MTITQAMEAVKSAKAAMLNARNYIEFVKAYDAHQAALATFRMLR